jgi:hypothetical protein
MMEEDLRIAIGNFNRFRRPDVEARLVGVDKTSAVVEFISTKEIDIKYLSASLKDGIESVTQCPVTVEPRKKGKTNMAIFTIKKDYKEEENPMDRAMRIMDKYTEGTPKDAFGMED